MTRHLTSRFWQCAVFGWAGVFFAMVSKEIEPLALSMPFIWAIVFSYVDGWWPQVTVTTVELSSERLIEGDELLLHVSLTASADISWLETEVQIPASLVATGPMRFVGTATAQREIQQTFRMQAIRWGVTGPQWLTVVTRDRLGMTERVEHLAIAQQTRVHPPTERLTSLIPLDFTRQVTGDHRSSRRGAGSELAEVRPYRVGDPIRSVHGGLSARRGVPMVLERHPDESADVVLFLDSVQDIGEGLDTSLRWTVTAAMALTQRHLRSMDRVGILDRGAGVRWLQPALGRRALHTIVEALLSTAVLRPRMDDQHVVPVDRIPRGATIFCISPLASTVVRQDLLVLRRRGHEVLVIQPQLVRSQLGAAISLAERIGRVQTGVYRSDLVSQGIVVIPWNSDEPLEPTMRLIGNHLSRFRGVS